MRCGEIRSDKIRRDVIWRWILTQTLFDPGCRPQECALRKAGVMATWRETIFTFMFMHVVLLLLLLLLLLCYTTTHTDTSCSTIAALLLGCYTVMGLLSCGVGWVWVWCLKLYGPCDSPNLLHQKRQHAKNVFSWNVSRVQISFQHGVWAP